MGVQGFYIAMKSYDLQQLSFILLLQYTGVILIA